MKKQLIKSILLATLIPAFLSCASSKNTNTVTNDDYSDQIEDVKTNMDDSANESSETKDDSDEETIQIEKEPAKKKGYFDSLFKYGNKGQYASVDETSVFTRSLTGSITQKKSVILVEIEKGTAGYGSNFLSNYYIIQFDKESRQKVRDAYEKYLKDFENKKLVRKSNKTFKAYGTTPVHINWGTLSNSTPNNGDGKMYLGYEFVKGSPYFTIECFPIENHNYDPVIDAVDKESMALQYYFAKAQAQELLNGISEENIAEICGIYTTDKTIKKVESDEY